MARLNISQLPLPADEFRPDLISPRFETEQGALKEDLVRGKRLLQAADMATEPANQECALALAHKLKMAGEHRIATLASSVTCRDHRIRVGGNMLRLVEIIPPEDLATFCLSPSSLEVAGSELAGMDPKMLGEALRSDFNRHKVSAATGAVIAFLDGEYEPNSDIWRLHWHGLVIGKKVSALENLRGTRKYRSTRYRGRPGRSKQRIQIRRKLDNLPYHLPYLLKSFWPSRWEGWIDGRPVRQSYRSRIPEPRHSQWLLWMDRWSLQDLCVLVGLRVGSHGLTLTKKYMNGDGQ